MVECKVIRSVLSGRNIQQGKLLRVSFVLSLDGADVTVLWAMNWRYALCITDPDINEWRKNRTIVIVCLSIANIIF